MKRLLFRTLRAIESGVQSGEWRIESGELRIDNVHNQMVRHPMARSHRMPIPDIRYPIPDTRYPIPDTQKIEMKKFLLISLLLILITELSAQDFITEKKEPGSFAVFSNQQPASIYVDESDHFLVGKAGSLLQDDIEMVTGKKPTLFHNLPGSAKYVIIIGSIDKSPVIARLVNEKKLNVDSLKGKWETYKIQVIDHPFQGIETALVIAGSDRRGTAYGVFELSRQMGVSPWYWWADVPVKKKTEVYVNKGAYQYGPPAVKYRGFFINDEAPAFSGWTKEKFGGVNHKVYEKIFELLLRMKANYLWPAMWGNAFNDDDTLNPVMADQYGIVMGTTHHEPMLRAQQEWKRYGKGAWDYDSNAAVLKEFWKTGIEHMGNRESIVSIGMRGDGDKPMTQGTAINLLERIVKDQRTILQEVTGKNPAQIPQLWALYKEVQDYYDKGMRVPDDVTLLLCDDNWGNIRKLPKPGEKSRAGGYGIYYHFDYVGGPRNYKWLNTNPISRVWEQMHLAIEYGADRIWIVNIGDIKPMEFPTNFFLDYAWNPIKWPAERLEEYTRLWAKEQFGEKYASPISELLSEYTKYNARRKPELLSADVYSLLNYREAETIVSDYNKLRDIADSLYEKFPAEYQNAFYQLVLHPIQACANLNELWVTVGKNRMYAAQGRAATNELAEKAKKLFARDSTISHYYNKILSGGKWDHMMDQTHISYTYWQQPPKDTMPQVKSINLPAAGEMGIAIEGSSSSWPKETKEAILPELDPYTQRDTYVEIFNKGRAGFNYSIESGVPWLTFSSQKGSIEKEQRIWITVDWQKAPSGKQQVPIFITGSDGGRVSVFAGINNPVLLTGKPVNGFAQTGRYVSMEAEHYTKAINTSSVKWQVIPGIGRTGSGMEPLPVTAPVQSPDGNSPHLEYIIHFTDTGAANIHAYCSPTLNFDNADGLHYAISIDNDPPQMVNLHADKSNKAWEQWVANNIIITQSQHTIKVAGAHVLKFWMVDPAVVLQKIVVDMGGVRPSYLGPPESFWGK